MNDNQTNSMNPLSVAPMMDYTDRHFRYFMRQITRHTLLYTEMIVTAAIKHGDRSKLLDFSPEEKPLSLQLGGDKPHELAECAIIAEDWGYDEVNLNVGCPSDRVQSGHFGACLMANPDLVAQCVEKMQKAVTIPVTVKHRIGIDDQDSYENMAQFVKVVSDAGCQRFTVHARKAWLKGLSPKENRNIPPLRYEAVYRLKQEFPHLFIEINGGITNLEQVRNHLELVDAVMIGRAAYDNPYLFATVDRDIYQDKIIQLTRHEIIEKMLPYIDDWVSRGHKLHKISRHLLAIFSGIPGTKAWKRHISENAHLPDADSKVIVEALKKVSREAELSLPLYFESFR
ncbi:tRNA dihydrouridine(20/20a) synthase DusA [Crocosphaera chwakensis]|uniref:tRNA-dihydrouridine(20/20a) synthase n=1 Tax=Crocosphaera chwakensis CCY0110 TaxID=391612 RepID=A3IQK4_9CHRO|nr:tRNA dihydrouridine(20/20a) synthase DusA [Crocosphaera chwakensis]EAZ91279.1 tRNA-dihydrouridine synthase A [Crocosphaera chwakensis CCY0110]